MHEVIILPSFHVLTVSYLFYTKLQKQENIPLCQENQPMQGKRNASHSELHQNQNV